MKRKNSITEWVKEHIWQSVAIIGAVIVIILLILSLTVFPKTNDEKQTTTLKAEIKTTGELPLDSELSDDTSKEDEITTNEEITDDTETTDNTEITDDTETTDEENTTKDNTTKDNTTIYSSSYQQQTSQTAYQGTTVTQTQTTKQQVTTTRQQPTTTRQQQTTTKKQQATTTSAPKRGANGVILEELYCKYNTGDVGRVPKTIDELKAINGHNNIGFIYELSNKYNNFNVLSNEILLYNTSTKTGSTANDLIAIYGAPLSRKNDNIYIYSYSNDSKNETEKIYIEFIFSKNIGNKLSTITIGTYDAIFNGNYE